MGEVTEVLFKYELVDGRLAVISKAVVGSDNWIYRLSGERVVMSRYGHELRLPMSAIPPGVRRALLETRHFGDEINASYC